MYIVLAISAPVSYCFNNTQGSDRDHFLTHIAAGLATLCKSPVLERKKKKKKRAFILIPLSFIYPSTARVVGAPQMISQPISSFFSCSLLPSGTWRTPGLSIPWCCLPTSSSVCLVFFPISLCRARWFWPDLMNGGHDHTIAVCVSLQWSGGLRIVRLPAGSLHGLPRS